MSRIYDSTAACSSRAPTFDGRPAPAAVPQPPQQSRSGARTSTASPPSRRDSLRASDCSPAPLPATAPIAVSTTACEAHSLTVTTRTFGYAGRSASSAPAPEKPNAAAFSFVPGASHSKPSIAISPPGPTNAAAVSSAAPRPATPQHRPPPPTLSALSPDHAGRQAQHHGPTRLTTKINLG